MKESFIANQHNQGFSLFEMIIVMCGIMIIAVKLFEKIQFISGDAEKAAYYITVNAMKSGLNRRLGHAFIKNDFSIIKKLEKNNPIFILQEPPRNYLGEFFYYDIVRMPKGSWFYDKKEKELVYLIRNSLDFKPKNIRYKKIRLKVKLIYEMNKVGEKGNIEGITLKQAKPFTWEPV